MTSYLRVTRASGLWWVGHAAIHASYHFLQQLPCPEIALCKTRIVVCQIISWKHYSMMARAPFPLERQTRKTHRRGWSSRHRRNVRSILRLTFLWDEGHTGGGAFQLGRGRRARRKSDIGLSAGRAVWIRFCPNPSPTEPGRQSRETFRTQTGGSRRSAHERRCM